MEQVVSGQLRNQTGEAGQIEVGGKEKAHRIFTSRCKCKLIVLIKRCRFIPFLCVLRLLLEKV